MVEYFVVVFFFGPSCRFVRRIGIGRVPLLCARVRRVYGVGCIDLLVKHPYFCPWCMTNVRLLIGGSDKITSQEIGQTR